MLNIECLMIYEGKALQDLSAHCAVILGALDLCLNTKGSKELHRIE